MNINGLVYVADYLDVEAQQTLIEQVEAHPWSLELQRRVQHHGYAYDYRKRSLDSSAALGPLPGWLWDLSERLYRDGFCADPPDQVIVNEYLPGQGIALHVDCEPCFGDTILSLSLGSACVMDFADSRSDARASLLLERGSLLVLQGEARYRWKHGIARRKTDGYAGQLIRRDRRISLTFRNVILATETLQQS